MAFFLSGASSLIFQSIWGRMLAKVFGASSIAISTVVTIFMAGLGIGAFVAGKYADKIKNPLLTYGIIEGVVGVWALLVPFLVNPEGWLAGVNAYLRVELGSGSMGFMIARFFCVLPILLVPTTMMGASLPLLSRYFVSRSEGREDVGSWVGALYSINTFGAVAGVLLGSFLLMPNIGVSLTNTVAACMNFALAGMIFALRKQIAAQFESPVSELEESSEESESVSEDEAEDAKKSDTDAKKAKGKKGKKSKGKAKKPAEEKSEDEPLGPVLPAVALPISASARYFAFVAFAVSGLASLCYEVVWSRSLAMTIGSSFQAFAVILTTFLIGIAAGSAIASAILAGRKLLASASVASILLLAFTLSPWAVSDDLGTYALMLAAFSAPVIIILLAAMSQTKRPGAPPPTGAALLMLLAPVAAALIDAVVYESDRLSMITGSVAIALAIFFALLISLRRYPVLQLAIMPLFIAGAAFVNYLFQDEIPCAFAQLVSSLDDLPQHVGTVQFFMFLTTMMCTLPATVGMGAMFPLVLRIWTSGGDNVGRDVGNVYAGNTLGSIFGAWLPGFVLMQVYGMQKTIIIGMIVYLLLSLALLVASAAEAEKAEADAEPGPEASDEERERYKRRIQKRQRTEDGASVGSTVGKIAGRLGDVGGLGTVGAIAGAVVGSLGDEDDDDDDSAPAWYAVTIYILAPLIPALIAGLYWGGWRDEGAFRWNLSQMTLGVFRVSLAADACGPSWGEPDLVYYHDGLSTTVSVERWGRHYALKNNGKVDASNGDDMPTQIMVGAYPLLMHRDGPEDLDVAVIGFGSGVTVGSVLKFPVASVDVIELERSIPDASKYFQDVNGLDYNLSEFPYVEMDRLSIINDDGRNYLSSTDRMFDVIVSEPSNPWITGVSDLFTTDHFRITKQRLREGGIYCQWVQLYELSPENIKTIYRTFAESFEHVVVFSAEDLSSDTVLLGSDSPIDLNIEHLQEVYGLPGVPEELERAYIHSPYDVFARTLLATKAEVQQFAQIEYRMRGGEWVAFPQESNAPGTCNDDCRREPSPLNTDDNALIEFAAPRDLIGYQRYEGYLANIYSPEWPFGRLTTTLTGFGDDANLAADRYAEMALSLIAHGRKPEGAAFITRAQEAGDSRTTRVAAEVLTRLMSQEGEPQVAIETPVPGPQMAAEEARALTEGFATVREAVDSNSFATAHSAMEDIPAPVRQHSGPSMRLLRAYLLYKTAPSYPSRFRDAIDQFEDLIRTEPSYLDRHPEIYYFLAKAHDAELNFDKGVRNMRLYVETRIRIAERAREEAAAREALLEDGAATTDGEDSPASEEAAAAQKALRERENDVE
ncbi:MAG: fused MFS/spermidine synthase [Polyangiales bacterium]